MKIEPPITIIVICIALVWMILDHAINQEEFNTTCEQQEQLNKFKTDAIVGWVKQDHVTKQLYYEEVHKP